MAPDQPIVPQPALEDSAAFTAIPTYLARATPNFATRCRAARSARS